MIIGARPDPIPARRDVPAADTLDIPTMADHLDLLYADLRAKVTAAGYDYADGTLELTIRDDLGAFIRNERAVVAEWTPTPRAQLIADGAVVLDDDQKAYFGFDATDDVLSIGDHFIANPNRALGGRRADPLPPQ